MNKEFRFVEAETEVVGRWTETTSCDDWHCPEMIEMENTDHATITQGIPSCVCQSICEDGEIFECSYFGGIKLFTRWEWLPKEEQKVFKYVKCLAPLTVEEESK